MALNPPKDYKPEFQELGLGKVRNELLRRRWEPDKLAAARIWVESEDNKQWLSGKGETPPSDKKQQFRKWAIYIVVGFGLAYAASRIIQSL